MSENITSRTEIKQETYFPYIYLAGDKKVMLPTGHKFIMEQVLGSPFVTYTLEIEEKGNSVRRTEITTTTVRGNISPERIYQQDSRTIIEDLDTEIGLFYCKHKKEWYTLCADFSKEKKG